MALFSINTDHAEIEILLRKMLDAFKDNPNWEIVEVDGKVLIQKTRDSQENVEAEREKVNENLKSLLKSIGMDESEFWNRMDESEKEYERGEFYSAKQMNDLKESWS